MASPLSNAERAEIFADLDRNGMRDQLGAYADDLDRYEATVQQLEHQLAEARGLLGEVCSFMESAGWDVASEGGLRARISAFLESGGGKSSHG